MSRIKNKFKFNQILPFIIFALISLVVMSPQLLSHSMIIGEDCWFHMNRAYETMMQIKTGHYSYFLNLFSFNRSGRIVNSFYGPLGGYLEGLLLLIVKTWYRWEIANDFIVLMVVGLSTYYVARKLKSRPIPGLLIGIIYMVSFPLSHWVLRQNFDGFGAMLLPWFILAGYRIFRHRFNPIKLAFLVTIMSQLHLMSAVVGTISLLLSFIMANFDSGRIKLWLKAIEAGFLYLLMTINIWGSLLEVKSSNNLVPTIPYNTFLSPTHVINWRMILHPQMNLFVAEVLILLLIGIIFMIFKQWKRINIFLMAQGLVMTFVSSRYFPWQVVLRHYPMITSYLQFPERFLPLAIVSVLLLTAQLKPHIVVILLLLFIAIVNCDFAFQNDQATVGDQYNKIMRSSWNVILKGHPSFHTIENSLHSTDTGHFLQLANNHVPDYLPSKTKINDPATYYKIRPDLRYHHNIQDNRIRIRHSITGRNIAKLTFNVQPNRTYQLPFTKYTHTEMVLNHHSIRPKLNQIDAIEIRPTQRHNIIEAQYRPSHWYALLVIVELFTYLSLIINWFTKWLLSKHV